MPIASFEAQNKAVFVSFPLKDIINAAEPNK